MAIKKVTAINKMYPLGEKTVEAVIELDAPADPGSFTVPGRNITGASASGSTVTLQLDPEDPKAMTRKMIGFGPNTKTKVTGAKLGVRQKGSFGAVRCTEQINADIDSFKQFSFHTDQGDLVYHLYEPENPQNKRLPLVIFMHDSSVVSDDPKAALIQGMGGVVWALEEEQKKRPCYVLVPAYRQKTAFDDFTVTWECEETAALIRTLTEKYPIDGDRIYGTGQSMGCMMLYELIDRHPELFTAVFAVAGQWDPAKLAKMKGQKLWILISEKDEKAWPIMSEGVRLMEDGGGHAARGHLDAKTDEAGKRSFAEAVLAQGADIQFTWYEGDSDLPAGMKPFPGCYHLCTWLWAYDIEPVREWLYRQNKS